jgi:hypothetical protein
MDFAGFLTAQVVMTGLAGYVGKLWLTRVTEAIKQRHQTELLELKGAQSEEISRLEHKLDRAMQFDKTELAVWEQLRKDIVQEMWIEHRDLMKSMTEVHIKMQEYWGRMTDDNGLLAPTSWEQLDDLKQVLIPGKEPTVEKFRSFWRNVTLISPEGRDIAHKHLLMTYNLMGYIRICLAHPTDANSDRLAEFNNKLFGIEQQFRQHTAKQFGLEAVIPWMVRGENEFQNETIDRVNCEGNVSHQSRVRSAKVK